MTNNKENYIKSRYIDTKQANKKNRLFNGFHIQKGKRIARPFPSFYPNQDNI